MVTKKIVTTVILLSCFSFLFAQKKVTVFSPDKQITFVFNLASGHPEYTVTYKNKKLIEHSTLGLTFAGDDFFGNDLKTGPITLTDGINDYELPEGKTSQVHDTY